MMFKHIWSWSETIHFTFNNTYPVAKADMKFSFINVSCIHIYSMQSPRCCMLEWIIKTSLINAVIFYSSSIAKVSFWKITLEKKTKIIYRNYLNNLPFRWKFNESQSRKLTSCKPQRFGFYQCGQARLLAFEYTGPHLSKFLFCAI